MPVKKPNTMLDEERAADSQEEEANDMSLKYFCFRVVQDRDSKGCHKVRKAIKWFDMRRSWLSFPSLEYRVTPADLGSLVSQGMINTLKVNHLIASCRR